MKYKLLSVLYIAIAIFAIAAFDSMAKEPITFTQASQNPEATIAKYKDIWEDRTIKTVESTKRDYELGEIVGTITIPKMDYYEMPIYYGSDKVNNNWQITTAGYLGNWNMFGEDGRAVVGAHNYQLFPRLPELEEGDLFIIETQDDIYIYEVIGNTIYDHKTQDWTEVSYNNSLPYSVSLMTCYPIDKGIEATEDMYIVYSKMVKGTKLIYK